MKNLTPALLFAMTMTTPVEADSERCFAIGVLVAHYAEMRQDNRQLSTVMAEIDLMLGGLGEEDLAKYKEDFAAIKILVIGLYEEMPIYNTEAGKKKAIMELRDKAELECFNGLNK